ncbi:acetyltransferase [Vibrio cholerae]|nr:acetyltransferase [Vibrio cholerae]TXZ40379.1 acetyltransferase [Vibrio cholerae]
MVAVVVFRFSVMRCQPLRRALCLLRKYEALQCRTISREMPRALS